MRISSGVPGFDALVEGGLPDRAAIVVQGPAGGERDAFLLQFVVQGLKEGGCALVAVSSVSPATYKERLREAGVGVDQALNEDRLKFVDWFSHKEEPVHDVQQEGSTFKASIDLANVGIAISRAIASLRRTGELRAAIELLSPALGIYELREVYGFAKSTRAKLERFGFTSLFALDKEPHDERGVSSVREPFDGVVDIQTTQDGRASHELAVLSLKGTTGDSRYVPLAFGPDGLLAVSAAPNDSKLWLATARNLWATGRAEPALRSVESALSVDAGNSEAWALKAEILEAAGRRPEAVAARAGGPPSSEPPGTKPDHAGRLLAFAEQRLRRDSRDPDALFVIAAYRAKGGDREEAVAILEKLAEVDDAYPGLWVLKTMLHAKLGQLDKAQESRARRVEVESRLDRADREAATLREAEPTRFCASCHSAVLDEETVCPRCGAPVESRRATPPPPETPAKAGSLPLPGPRPGPHIPEPPDRVPRGLTNGLARDKPRGTGRTNGLAGGARASDMTNGLAKEPRTTGMTNGLSSGMTNGLASGLHSLRTGMTNGLTNGSGFTNGLGSPRHQREAAGRRWKLYLIPIVCATLLVAPLLSPAEGDRLPIAIDGEFSDWDGVPLLASAPAPPVPPNVDLVRVGVTDNAGYLAFYFEVAGIALAGGGSPPVMDTFRAFLDVDRDADTGYLVAGLGADRLVEVSGSAGRVQDARLSEWDAVRAALDWNGWIKSTFLSAAAGGSRVEAHVDWLALVSEKVTIDVAFHAMAYDGAVDTGDYTASTTGGSLRILETMVVPETISGTMVSLAQFDLAAVARDVTYDSLTIALTGTAPLSAISGIHLMDEQSRDLGFRVALTRDVTFDWLVPRRLQAGATETLTVAANVTGTSGDTLGATIDSPRDVGAGSAAVHLVRVPGARSVGYLGTIPTQAAVDGGFAEWTNTTSDATGEPGVPPRIDLVDSSFYLNAQRASAYFRVSGRAMDGALVPAVPADAPEGETVALADSDRDRVPDAADPLPFDFNNDGTEDVATAGDYDADGVLDYPSGPDEFLNTTIPTTFPAPYAGQDVSIFIGPIVRPVVLGEDVARVFLDGDDVTGTGFRVDAIGAEYLVEIRGKHGVITSRTLSAFGGGSPWEWTWTPLGTVDAASDFARVEFGFDISGLNLADDSRAYLELKDWAGASDDGGQATYRLGTRGDGFPQPFDIGGNTKYWLGDTNHGTEVACTTNKIAATTQGSAPVATTTLSAGQSACWYADATSGSTIPAGNWESLLDVSQTPSVSFDAASSTSISTGSSMSWSHTTSGSDRLLVVGVSWKDSGTTVSSVTYGGQALTSIGSRGPNGGYHIHMFRRIAPLLGTNTVTVTFSTSVGNGAVGGATSFKGVHQTTPLGTFASAQGVSTTASVVVTSAANEVVIDTVVAEATLTVGALQTQRWNLHAGQTDGGGSTEPGAATVTMSWSLSNSRDWVIGGVSVKPATVEYDVYLEIWNKSTDSVPETIGSCVDVTTYGDDVQCLVSGVGAKTLTSDQVVRVRVLHSSSSGTVTIDYDDADTTGDSRATIPPTGIPEFRDVAVPALTTVLVPIFWRRFRRRSPRRSEVLP